MSFAACGETNDMELAPTRCISAPLLPRDYSACRFLGSFSQKLPRWFTRQSKSEKGLRVLVRHGDKLRHDAFNKAAPRTKAVVALLALLNGKPAVKHLASVLILPDFLLREFRLGITFLDGLRRFSSLSWVVAPFLILGKRKATNFLRLIALGTWWLLFGYSLFFTLCVGYNLSFQKLLQVFLWRGDRCNAEILHEITQHVGRYKSRERRSKTDVLNS